MKGTLRVRLALCFAVVVVALLVLGAGLNTLARSLDRARSEGQAWSTVRQDLAALDAAWSAQAAAVRGYELTANASYLAEFEAAGERAAGVERSLEVLLAEHDAVADELGPTLADVVAARAAWVTEVTGERLEAVADGRPRTTRPPAEAPDAFETATASVAEADGVAADGQARARERISDRNTMLVTGSGLGLVVAAGGVLVLVLLLRRWITQPVETVATAVARVSEGQLDQSIPVVGPAEIAGLAADVDRMRLRLREEMARVMDASYVAAAEEERARLAGELHDDTLQTLAAVSLRLDLVGRQLPEGDVTEQLLRCRQGIQDASRGLRTLLFELHPPALDHAGLAAALEDYADFVLGGTGTEVEVKAELAEEPPKAIQALAYRVGRELVLNAAKHAGASALTIRVTSRDGGLDLVVEDDGVGLPDGGPAQPGGHGLRNLRELVARAGGSSRVGPRPGGGAQVAVWLPA